MAEWTEANFDFAGYVTGFDPSALGDRAGLRAELGYRADEVVCVVTVGGSGVGAPLLRPVMAAYPMARERVPGAADGGGGRSPDRPAVAAPGRGPRGPRPRARPVPPSGLEVVIAAGTHQNVADEFFGWFGDPAAGWDVLATPERTRDHLRGQGIATPVLDEALGS